MLPTVDNIYNSSTLCRSLHKQPLDQSKRYLISVQKSGTHLLAKILNQLHIPWSYENGRMHFVSRYDRYHHGEPISRILNKNRHYYILYRDPRDLIISQIFYQMTPAQSKKILNGNKFSRFTISQLITKSLNAEKIHEDKIGGYANRLFKSLKFVIQIKKKPRKNLLLLRFEDIIPSYAGGASEQRRLNVFRKICQFAGKKVDDAEIKKVMESCWGNTETFREGEVKKVGQWQRYFKPEHIRLFHKKYNFILMKLGYETDPNWHLKYLINTGNPQKAKT